jgi:RNA polymerase sigma-70 factor (ECF subfamily)
MKLSAAARREPERHSSATENEGSDETASRPVTHRNQRFPVHDDDALRRTQFERIVLPHLEEAFVFARALTGNPTDAQDIVQDASLSAYRAIAGYANGDARSWVLTIVRHSAYQWLRKNRRNAPVNLDSIEELEERGTPSEQWATQTPETALIAKTNAARLRQAILAIPEPFRETLILRELHGLDYREIAKRQHVPLGTVMSRLARARRRLIAELAAGEN